jgi:tRNA nucleotidyltransferase/poly(A) polymerase
MDTKGRVFDYLNGLRDLRNQTVRMAPHSRDSFQLDPNSIMRYFKAVSMFDHPRLLRKDLSWIRENVHLLADVADDQRVQMNLISILKSSNRQPTLDLMCSVGVGRYLPFLPC